MDNKRSATVLVVGLALCSLWVGTARSQPIGSSTQQLIRSPETALWTQNGNVIPMCWHQLLQFPDAKAASDAKAFVAQTIQDGWIRLLNLRTTWTDCPTSGNAKHVRVKLRIGDASNNGTTLAPGMGTLSTAAERLIPPPKDPPGLLMGFPANWNQDDGTRAGFRSLILHEFGHVLGFDHEQGRADGPTNVPCYKNAAVPGAIKIGPPDPASIMGWGYCTTASGVLTASDVSGARSVYGRGDIVSPAVPVLVQLHGDGAMWAFNGKACTADACPGWDLIDKNPRTETVAGNYQRHVDGQLFRWNGQYRCTGNECPGWTLIDKNPRTRLISAAVDGLYSRHVDGQIWKFTGGACTATACPGWMLIDKNPRTDSIAVGVGAFAQSDLYQRHVDGQIWKWDGRSTCTANACPGWTQIDKNPATKDIVPANGTLYQRHADGKIWKWDGHSSCSATACPGWTMIDKNPSTAAISGGYGGFFQRHVDGKIWRWDGKDARCSENACPGWTLLDQNPNTKDIVAAGTALFQRHADGKIWKWDGHSHCEGKACPGWILLDRNPNTKGITAMDTKFEGGFH